LVTLALDYPIHHPRREARVAYFRGEVENFLLLAQQLGRDPASFKGSFAGAMGLPQFMPSSWRKFAVDFDADGRIDLWSSPSDAIGSIASYFKGYGWQSGLATHISLPSSALSSAALSSPPHSPNQSPTLPAGFTLLELENGELEPTRLGVSPNFFVITKYNNSYNYAAAVIELGAAVSEAYHSK
jgi:membrane-bound lytic murein transglycosylase B